MDIKKLFKRTFSVVALAAATFTVATPVYAVGVFHEFVVNEAPYGGGLVTADKLNGGYSERITFDGSGGFTTAAYGDFGQLFANDGGLQVPSRLNVGYGLYAIFNAVGNVGMPLPGLFSFNASSANFTLYLDRNNDTVNTLGATGSDPVTSTNAGDDEIVAAASQLSSSNGLLVSGVGGFFDLVFEDFALTPFGAGYFVSPDPFYLRVNVDGDFDNFAVVGTQTVTGDLSAAFVPEPGTLALFGIALLGLGAAQRRRVK